jgi:hypothetical protein
MTRTGRKPRVSDEELLEAMESFDSPMCGTPELGEKVDLSRRGLHDRLGRMQKRGLVDRRKYSGTTLWWPVEGWRDVLEAERQGDAHGGDGE